MTRTWNACWIWPRDRREPNLHLLFRKDFEIGENPESANLYIAAESAAQVFLNGVELGRTSANSYPGQHYYEVMDCLSALTKGTNRIAILARYIGIPSSASIPKDPGVLCEIVCKGKEGTFSIGSDATWKYACMDAWRGRQRMSEWLNLDQVENVDRRLLPKGFPFPEDLSGFVEPEAARWPGVRFTGLEARPFAKASFCGDAGLSLLKAGTVIDRSADWPIPAIAISEEEIEPQSFAWDGSSAFTIPAQPAGRAFSMLIGMDDYYNGRVDLTVTGSAGVGVDIAWHEKLMDGRFEVRDTKVYTAIRFVLAEGENRIVPEDWMAGRFLQFTFRNISAPLQVASLRFGAEAYPVRQRLKFSSSNEKLNRIVEISLAAARHCMHDNIMDCPWRERRQWIGDVQRISLINHFAFGDRALVRAVLQQHPKLQDPSGRIWVCVPIWEEFPTQNMEWLRAVLEYDHYTGDQSLLGEVFDNAEMLHRWFLRNRDERGLFFINTAQISNWMDNPFSKITLWQYAVPFLVTNLRYLLFLDDMAECFQKMGRFDDQAQTLQERQKLAERIREHFTDKDTGLLSDCAEMNPDRPPMLLPNWKGEVIGSNVPPKTFSEMGHALAVCTDLLPTTESRQLWDRFMEYQAKHPKDIIRVSPFGKYHVHRALAKLELVDELIADILVNWGPMVDAGAMTTWESFGGGESHCHGWAGIPVLALCDSILGLDPRKPSKARKENVGGIEWMEAEIRRE